MENKWVKNFDLYNSKISDIDYIEKAYAYLFDTKNNISDKAKQKEISILLDKINEHRQKALELNKSIKTDELSLSDKINIETTELPVLRKNVNNILRQYKTSIDNENKTIDNPNISNELKKQADIRKKENEIINKKLSNYLDIIPETKKEEVKEVTTPVVDTTRQEKETNTPTTTQPVQNTQQQTWSKLWRQFVYDDKKNVLWFVSALKDKDWKRIIRNANWVDDANKQIKEWVIWYNAKLYNSLSWEETTDWVKQITKQQTDLRNRLIKDWFTEAELNERWIY